MNNILYLPTRFFPSISGAEFYFQRIAEIFLKKYKDCYNIDIFTSNAIDFKALRDPNGKIIEENKKYYRKVTNLRINRFSIDYKVPLIKKIKKLKSIKAFKSLNLTDECLRKFLENGPYLPELLDYALKLEENDYDLIHTTFFPYFNLIVALIIGKLLNKPTICTPFFHFANPRYLHPSTLQVLEKFDILIACTNHEKAFLMKKLDILRKTIEIIPMGVDYERFERVHSTVFKNYYFKDKFFRNKERNYKMVLFCGYKNYEKGSISILKAIPYILEKNKKVYFVFIGPTTTAFNRELSKIQKLENVRIINFTPDNLTGYFDKKKLTAFKETDVFLMPSRTDAYGIAFLEAWASGKPVIGANIGATPEVIRDKIDGFLVEFDNPKDIAEKVIKLLKKKKLREKLGKAGQYKVKNYNSWDIIAKNTSELYQQLIKKF